jgi:hypothetical protein
MLDAAQRRARKVPRPIITLPSFRDSLAIAGRDFLPPIIVQVNNSYVAELFGPCADNL